MSGCRAPCRGTAAVSWRRGGNVERWSAPRRATRGRPQPAGGGRRRSAAGGRPAGIGCRDARAPAGREVRQAPDLQTCRSTDCRPAGDQASSPDPRDPRAAVAAAVSLAPLSAQAELGADVLWSVDPIPILHISQNTTGRVGCEFRVEAGTLEQGSEASACSATALRTRHSHAHGARHGHAATRPSAPGMHARRAQCIGTCGTAHARMATGRRGRTRPGPAGPAGNGRMACGGAYGSRAMAGGHAPYLGRGRRPARSVQR